MSSSPNDPPSPDRTTRRGHDGHAERPVEGKNTPELKRVAPDRRSPGRNANTCHVELSPVRSEKLDAALELAWRTVDAVPRPACPGVHVFRVRGQEVSVRFLPASRGEYMVIGRHEGCDLRLRGDSTVSLRHLLARAIQLADGTQALRLIDLGTQRPFQLPDGTMHRALVATGPFVIGLGDYAIGGIPADAGAYRTHGRPYRASAIVEASDRLPNSSSPPTSGLRRSRITLMPGSRFVTHVPAWRDQVYARLTLARGPHITSTVVGESTLEHGVLIGRAPRCIGQGFSDVLTNNISRVHLMILRDPHGVVALDLCSTQGTFSRAGRVRAVPLRPESHSLQIGYLDPVTLNLQRLG